MTTGTRSDAWWSPVPGWPDPDLEPVATAMSYAPQTYGLNPYGPLASTLVPTGPPTPTATTTPRRRRRAWPFAVVAAAVLLLVGGLVVGLTRAGGTQVLRSPSGSVSVDVPRSWYDNSSPGATDAPVIAASNLWSTRSVRVDLWAIDKGDTLRSFHAASISEECANVPCGDVGRAEVQEVDGHQAIEQVLTHPAGPDDNASTTVTLTVWMDDHVVQLFAVASTYTQTAPDPEPLQRIAASLTIV